MTRNMVVSEIETLKKIKDNKSYNALIVGKMEYELAKKVEDLRKNNTISQEEAAKMMKDIIYETHASKIEILNQVKKEDAYDFYRFLLAFDNYRIFGSCTFYNEMNFYLYSIKDKDLSEKLLSIVNKFFEKERALMRIFVFVLMTLSILLPIAMMV